MSVLEAHGLSVSIAGITVCRRLDLAIESGSRWAILGKNGAGKTTLLRTLAGLHAADSGSIHLDGKPFDQWSSRQRARRIGMLFQEQTNLFSATVLETAMIGRHPHIDGWRWEGSDDVAQTRSALGELGLAGLEARSVASLSGGERQRLAIATLLTQAPDLYLLDEPVNHLDLHHQVEVMDLLCNRVGMAGGRALIAIVHDVNLAARFCDHGLLVFGQGDTRAGRIDEVMTMENLERLYGHPLMALTSGRVTYFVPR